jgi:hypothetical protein
LGLVLGLRFWWLQCRLFMGLGLELGLILGLRCEWLQRCMRLRRELGLVLG